MKTTAEFNARGWSDAKAASVDNNSYAKARLAFYSASDSWQGRAYMRGYYDGLQALPVESTSERADRIACDIVPDATSDVAIVHTDYSADEERKGVLSLESGAWVVTLSQATAWVFAADGGKVYIQTDRQEFKTRPAALLELATALDLSLPDVERAFIAARPHDDTKRPANVPFNFQLATYADGIRADRRAAMVQIARAKSEYLRRREWSDRALDERAFHAFALTCDKDGNHAADRAARYTLTTLKLQSAYARDCRSDRTARAMFVDAYALARQGRLIETINLKGV